MTKHTHGGRRPGAGRKPRTDGRTWRIIKLPLTDTELELIKSLPPDKRRRVLLRAAQAEP